MPVKKKKKATKRPSGLAKYQATVKRATKVVDARIKKTESVLKKLKAEKARKVKSVRSKLKKSK